ncbi:hypothetical protein DNR41_27700, partial [Escherichia coli]|uniref:hypothetical protein n=1 Tax=Escherichia coli TaxID=562 RepID=UPI000DBC10FD
VGDPPRKGERAWFFAPVFFFKKARFFFPAWGGPSWGFGFFFRVGIFSRGLFPKFEKKRVGHGENISPRKRENWILSTT